MTVRFKDIVIMLSTIGDHQNVGMKRTLLQVAPIMYCLIARLLNCNKQLTCLLASETHADHIIARSECDFILIEYYSINGENLNAYSWYVCSNMYADKVYLASWQFGKDYLSAKHL